MTQYNKNTRDTLPNNSSLYEVMMQSDKDGNLSNISPTNVAAGLVTGYEVINIFGHNSTIGTDFIAPWEENVQYVYQSSAIPMTVDSNATDDGVIIKIIGLGADYIEHEEIITLDNATPPVTSNFLRINSIFTISGNALNDITLSNGSVIYGKINALTGASQKGIYTVPAGKTFFINRISAFSATTTGNSKYLSFRNYISTPDGVNLRIAELTFLNKINILRSLPFKVAEKTDIQFQMKSSSGFNEGSVAAEGILIDNSFL